MKRKCVEPQTDVHWVSESGVIDCRVLLGPSPQQLFSQYAQVTGVNADLIFHYCLSCDADATPPRSGYQALPPLFALGYHQCRYSYEDEADVKAVDAGFDQHGIPYDVIWLDIDHTDDKRYFTWDPARFPEPVRLQRHLEAKKRKVSFHIITGFFCWYIVNLQVVLLQLVAISDPHIKVDPDWWLYREARDQGHFIQNRDGQIFQGSCWSGNVFKTTGKCIWFEDIFGIS